MTVRDLVAGGAGARGVLDAAGGRDDELVGGEHELGRHRVVARGVRARVEQAVAAARARPASASRGLEGARRVSQRSVEATSVTVAVRREVDAGSSPGLQSSPRAS